MKILVTGGAGYIGSHTALELLNLGYEIAVLDNLSNSSEESLRRIKEITGKDFPFFKADIRDKEALRKIFGSEDYDCVIHFAGLKAVGESVEKPLLYYENNVAGTVNMLEVMQEAGCKKIIFSSSATVYGVPKECPIKETHPTSAVNPYGETKLTIEHILTDLCVTDPSWHVMLLRYFNPIGAHESGLIGEDPEGIPNNLMPYVAQVAVGRLDHVNVFGNDYNTPDGTGVRDYIHVTDLALGHIAALEKIDSAPGVSIYNLGTGNGYSVLEVIAAFSKASGKNIPYEIAPRRSGDIDICFADPSLAKEKLGWAAKFDINRMCEDTWRWQSKNPYGYRR